MFLLPFWNVTLLPPKSSSKSSNISDHYIEAGAIGKVLGVTKAHEVFVLIGDQSFSVRLSQISSSDPPTSELNSEPYDTRSDLVESLIAKKDISSLPINLGLTRDAEIKNRRETLKKKIASPLFKDIDSLSKRKKKRSKMNRLKRKRGIFEEKSYLDSGEGDSTRAPAKKARRTLSEVSKTIDRLEGNSHAKSSITDKSSKFMVNGTETTGFLVLTTEDLANSEFDITFTIHKKAKEGKTSDS